MRPLSLSGHTALDRRVWDQVESLVYYFLFPVLLFHSIVRSPLDFGATSHLLAAGLGVVLTGGDGAFLAARLPKCIFVVPELVLLGLNRILAYHVDK